MATAKELDALFVPEKEEEPDNLDTLFRPEAQEEPQADLDKLFVPESTQEAQPEPSRAGAIGRAVAEEFVPATAAGLAVGAISKLPLPAVPKFLVGATGAILSAGVAGRTQEAIAGGVVGPEAVEQFKAQRERDIAQYPVSTFAASALTPTVGALAGLGRKGIGAAGGAIRKAFTEAEQAAPEAVEAGAVKTFYHGSPSTEIDKLQPDSRGLVFMSESKDVASSYRLSRTKNVDLAKAGLTDDEIKSYRAYKNAIATQPEISPESLLSGKQFDEASSALEKLDTYERGLAEQGRIYEISIPTSKLIDYREGDRFYQALEKVRDDLYAKGEKRLGNIVQNSIFNKIPPQSRFLDKPFFDSLKKQDIEGITLPHSKEGTETMVVQGVIKKPLGAEPARVPPSRERMIEEVKARAEPGQKMRATAERLLGDAKTPEELAQKIADKRNRALYDTYSPQTLAKNLRVLSPEDRAVIAQGDDLVGKVAKFVSAEDYRLSGNVQAADLIYDDIFKTITNYAQGLNLGKLISTTPDGYAYILNKTLLNASRKFATDLEKSGAEKTSKITEDLRKQAIDLFTKRQATQAAYDEAKLVARKDLSKKAGRLAEEAENKALLASYELASFEARLLAKDLGQQASDHIKGNLLTTISQSANILGNTVNMPARAATRQVASFLDQLERNVVRPIVTRLPGGKGFAEKYLASEKQFMSPIGRGSLERFLETGKAGGRGVKEGVVGLKRGISAEGLLAGEDIRGFQPLKAWEQLFTGKGLAQPIATGAAGAAARTMDKVRLLSEGTLGIPPEVMFRLLQLGDAPARRMAQARLLSERAQLRGLKGRELQRAVRFPLQEEVDKIAQEAAEAVYQQDTQLSRGIKWLTGMIPGYLENIPGIGKTAAGAARAGITAVIPYQKTPTNVIDEILEYAIPEYSFVKGLAEQGQGKFRSAKLKFAKSIVGWGIGNVADMLSNAGVITSAASKSEKVRDVQLASEGSKMLNLTGSQRFMESGERQETRPGDTLVSLEKLGVVGAIMSTRNAARQATEGGSGSVGEAWAATLPQTLKFGFEQSFLRNMNSLLGAISRGEAKDIDSWLANYYSALSSAVIPNQVSAYSRYLSRNMPDKMMAKDIPGSDFATKSLNIFKEVIKRKLPRDAGDLPSRINVWGQPIPQTPEGVDPFIYNFIDPTKTRKATYDDLTLAVYDLYKKTNQTEGIPQVPNRELDVVKRRTGQKARYRLDPFLYEEYARQVGRANRQVAEDLFSNRGFRKLDPYEQVKQLENAYRAASKVAREAFIRKNQRSIEAGQEL